jgi:EmrB/QacA subfamily drug resistance transporter
MLTPVAMSIITNTFTDLGERARAIGVWGAVTGLSAGFGPVLGGVLVTSVGWRSIFWINIPIGVAAVTLALRYVPESRAEIPRRPDVLGQILMIVFLTSLTYGLIEGPSHHWTSSPIPQVFALAGIALVGFLLWEPRQESPLINPKFFQSIPFASAVVMAVISVGALSGFVFLNTLYLQEARGFSAFKAGLFVVPTAMTSIVCATLSGRVLAKRGARIPLVIAGLGLTIASLMFVRLSVTTPLWWLLIAYVLRGVGSGFVTPPVTYTTVSGMPRAQAGVAASITSTSRQIGATLGVAILGSMVAVTGRGTLHSEFAAKSHTAWWTLAGCGVVILVLGIVATSPRAIQSAIRTARNLNPEVLTSSQLTDEGSQDEAGLVSQTGSSPAMPSTLSTGV